MYILIPLLLPPPRGIASTADPHQRMVMIPINALPWCASTCSGDGHGTGFEGEAQMCLVKEGMLACTYRGIKR